MNVPTVMENYLGDYRGQFGASYLDDVINYLEKFKTMSTICDKYYSNSEQQKID